MLDACKTERESIYCRRIAEKTELLPTYSLPISINPIWTKGSTRGTVFRLLMYYFQDYLQFLEDFPPKKQQQQKIRYSHKTEATKH